MDNTSKHLGSLIYGLAILRFYVPDADILSARDDCILSTVKEDELPWEFVGSGDAKEIWKLGWCPLHDHISYLI